MMLFSESSQQIGQIPNTIQPIKLHDIIVRKCSLEFYNSKKEQVGLFI